jgi:sarcosine oxidase/L-pipecolate oxidase
MSSVHVYDVVIVGAGIEGSCVGYYLSSTGTSNVLIIEQFDRGHIRGSSHGGSRITRKAYSKSFYVKMMEESYQLWNEIEKESKQQLYHKTGILVFGSKSDAHANSGMDEYVSSLEVNGIPHDVMSGDEVNDKYPHQLQLPHDYMCVYEEFGGILRASKAVTAIQDLFIGHGGDIRDNHRVTRITPGDVITVETERGDFKCNNLILTTGAWTNKLTQPIGLSLPLKVTKAEVLYWKVNESKYFSTDNFPVFICNYDSFHFYGTPILEYPGLIKICPQSNIEVDPDARDCNPSCTSYKNVSQFIQTHFKNVIHEEPAIYELAVITHTPDHDPFIDRHPVYSNIIIGAGFSGHGFKLGPVVGKIITEMILNQTPTYDMTPFRINRFN